MKRYNSRFRPSERSFIRRTRYSRSFLIWIERWEKAEIKLKSSALRQTWMVCSPEEVWDHPSAHLASEIWSTSQVCQPTTMSGERCPKWRSLASGSLDMAKASPGSWTLCRKTTPRAYWMISAATWSFQRVPSTNTITTSPLSSTTTAQPIL